MSTPTVSQNADILSRLHRLESLLAAQNGEDQDLRGQLSASPPQIETLNVSRGVNSLGNAALDQIPSTKTSMSQIQFKTCPIEQVTYGSSCIWLPLRAEAQKLLDKYIGVAHHMPCVTHLPSLSSVLDQVYSSLNQRDQMPPGQIILLLSIFAAATYAWIESDCACGLFSSSSEANDQASIWIKTTEDMLNIACRSPKVSIEVVQGAVIVGFIAAHLDGLHRYRVLLAMTIVLARNLGLHRIDHPSHANLANTAQAEIGRRVWWYLCTSDWSIAARVGGMAEGTYSCHPRQMITKKPLNINDEEIFDGMNRDEHSLAQPTTMSYTMQRIRLAEISRSMVDRSPLAMAHTSGLSHDAVMDIDTELQTLINDVPAFYSMSKTALMESYGLTQTQAENIAFTGKTTYFLLYAQRCKLHLPYFARSFEEPAFLLSREICIKHAHLIIQSELWQESSDIDTGTRFKFIGLLIGVFLACIVLLMDICVNPSSPQYEKQRAEVYKAFKIIEEAKQESHTTAKFVDSLVHILRKYNMPSLESASRQQKATSNDHEQHFPADHGTQTALDVPVVLGYTQRPQVSHSGHSPGQLGSDDGISIDANLEGPLNDDGEDLSSYWNDFTQSFEQGIDVSSFDWDNIFLELDSSFV